MWSKGTSYRLNELAFQCDRDTRPMNQRNEGISRNEMYSYRELQHTEGRREQHPPANMGYQGIQDSQRRYDAPRQPAPEPLLKGNKPMSEIKRRYQGLREAIPESNKGFSMMQRMGYMPGSAIGKSGSGILEPVKIGKYWNRQGFARKKSRGKKGQNTNNQISGSGYVSFVGPNTKEIQSKQGKTNLDRQNVSGPGSTMNNSAGPSNSFQSKKQQKAERRAAGTWNQNKPNSQPSKSSTSTSQQSGGSKRPFVDAGSPTSTSRPAKKFKSPPEQDGFRVAVIDQRHPEFTLDQSLSDQIQNKLVSMIDNVPRGSQPPQFLNTDFRNGILWVTCANEKTKTWLTHTVKDFKDITDLMVVIPTAIPKRYKYSVWVPDTGDVEAIRTRFRNQNPDLNTNEWLLTNREVDEKGQTLTFSISQKSFQMLEKADFKAFCGLGRVTFKILEIAKKEGAATKRPPKKRNADVKNEVEGSGNQPSSDQSGDAQIVSKDKSNTNELQVCDKLVPDAEKGAKNTSSQKVTEDSSSSSKSVSGDAKYEDVLFDPNHQDSDVEEVDNQKNSDDVILLDSEKEDESETHPSRQQSSNAEIEVNGEQADSEKKDESETNPCEQQSSDGNCDINEKEGESVSEKTTKQQSTDGEIGLDAEELVLNSDAL